MLNEIFLRVLFFFFPKIYGSPLCILFHIREEYKSLGKEDQQCSAFPNNLKSAAHFPVLMLRQNSRSPINPSAILPLWLIGIYIGKKLFAFAFADKNGFTFTEIFSR